MSLGLMSQVLATAIIS